MAKWLVKSDPETYSWDMFVQDNKTIWDGVRNFQARNNLAKMLIGDEVLFYHSNKERAIFGIASVSKEAFPDPTSNDTRWLAVELKYEYALNKLVSLGEIKQVPSLASIGLIKQSRLSVMQLSEVEFDTILSLAKSE